jgi:hypothetical protein
MDYETSEVLFSIAGAGGDAQPPEPGAAADGRGSAGNGKGG